MELSKREKLGLITFSIVIICILAFNFYRKSNTSIEIETKETPSVSLSKAPDIKTLTTSIKKSISVYVCGEVKIPGVYNLLETDRIDSAIKAAGGFTDKADKNSINLAQKLKDEAQIFVYSKGANKQPANITTNETNNETGKININSATKEELMKLPRIGEALSQRIIDYRDQNGPFSDIKALDKVSGIGTKMLESISNLIITS